MLSIILLGYNSGNRINIAFDRLNNLLTENHINYELIIVDDGSLDDTYARAARLVMENKGKVKAIKLSRNFTSHYAIFAGLTKAAGDCITVIPDDEQQPYETLVKMYDLWAKGHKVILPYRITRDDLFLQKLFSQSFYSIMNKISDISFPKYGIDTFFIDKSVAHILRTQIRPIATTTITEILRLGFSPEFIGYDRPIGFNEGKSRWTIKKKLKLARDTFYSSSTFPIRFINLLGLTTFLFSLILSLIYLINKVIGYADLPAGWSTIVILISFFSGLILLSLGIIANYLHLVYIDVKNRPGFIIEKFLD